MLCLQVMVLWNDVFCLLPDAAREQDLRVDLSTHVIDVYSRCGPFLAARDTVEPAV